MKRPKITPQALASLGLVCLSVAVFALLPAGCPSATTDPNSQVSDGNSATGTDANNPSGTGSGSGSTDPNTSGGSGGGTGGTDPNSSGGTGGTGGGTGGTDPNGSSGGSGGSGGGGSGGGGTTPAVPTTIALNEIVRTGGTVPDQVAGVTFTGFSKPIIDSKGRVAFWGTYAGTGAHGKSGLYVWDTQTSPPALRRIIHNDPNTAGTVPNRPADTYFGRADPNFSPIGQPIAWGGGDRLLFVSQLEDNLVDSFKRFGIYRWKATDGTILRVTDFAQFAGLFTDVKLLPDGSTPMMEMGYGGFGQPGISDDGAAMFSISYRFLTKSGSPFFRSGTGVYTSNGTTVTAIFDTLLDPNLPVPDQAAGTVFLSPGLLMTNNATGDMLFQSTYTSDSAGDGRGVYLVRNATIFRAIDTRANASWTGLPLGAQVVYDPNVEFAVALGPAGHIAVDGSLTANSVTNHAVLRWDPNAASWSSLTGLNATPASALASGVNSSGQAVIIAGGNPFLASSSGQTQLNATLPAQLQGAALTWATAGAAVSNYSRAVLPYAYTDGSGSGLAFWTSQQLLLAADSKLGAPMGLAQIGVISDPESDRPGRSGTLDDADEFVFRAILSDSSQVIYKVTSQ